MEIKPHKGIDDIILGMSIEDVVKLIGNPDEIIEDEDLDFPHHYNYEYEKHGLELCFAEDDEYKLGTITVMSKEHTLLSEKLIGLNEKDFLAKAKEIGLTDIYLSEELESLKARDYYSDSQGLSFWLEDGIVTSIALFPDYEMVPHEQPIWPE